MYDALAAIHALLVLKHGFLPWGADTETLTSLQAPLHRALISLRRCCVAFENRKTDHIEDLKNEEEALKKETRDIPTMVGYTLKVPSAEGVVVDETISTILFGCCTAGSAGQKAQIVNKRLETFSFRDPSKRPGGDLLKRQSEGTDYVKQQIKGYHGFSMLEGLEVNSQGLVVRPAENSVGGNPLTLAKVVALDPKKYAGLKCDADGQVLDSNQMVVARVVANYPSTEKDLAGRLVDKKGKVWKDLPRTRPGPPLKEKVGQVTSLDQIKQSCNGMKCDASGNVRDANQNFLARVNMSTFVPPSLPDFQHERFWVCGNCAEASYFPTPKVDQENFDALLEGQDKYTRPIRSDVKVKINLEGRTMYTVDQIGDGQAGKPNVLAQNCKNCQQMVNLLEGHGIFIEDKVLGIQPINEDGKLSDKNDNIIDEPNNITGEMGATPNAQGTPPPAPDEDDPELPDVQGYKIPGKGPQTQPRPRKYTNVKVPRQEDENVNFGSAKWNTVEVDTEQDRANGSRSGHHSPWAFKDIAQDEPFGARADERVQLNKALPYH